MSVLGDEDWPLVDEEKVVEGSVGVGDFQIWTVV